jgi:hypothetical protein
MPDTDFLATTFVKNSYVKEWDSAHKMHVLKFVFSPTFFFQDYVPLNKGRK